MSKSSAASATKVQPQLSQTSAWSRGPPQSTSSAPTPRSQSPAPNAPPASAGHSRRPSALGQGVSFKDGVGAARNPSNTVKHGSTVTFGSIDDASAPISSSPASVPPIKSEGVKSFGTVPATPTSAAAPNGKPAAPSSSASSSKPPPSSSATPPVSIKPKFDVKKLFQAPSSPSPSAADVTSPSSRPSPLPHPSPPTHQPHPSQQQQHQHQQPPPQQHQQAQHGSYGHQFQPFVPGGYRPQQNGTSGPPPRSPVIYARQAAPNGPPPGANVNGRGAGPAAQGGPSIPPTMPSPRMGHPSAQQPAMSPQPWGYYSYPVDPQQYHHHYYSQWGMMPPPQQPPAGGPPPHPGMPLSPRNPPPQLHPPGTPTMTSAIPPQPPHSTPSPHIHTSSLSSVSSPPVTPSSSTGPGPAGSRGMRTDVPPFIPKRSSVKISDPSDPERHVIQVEKLKENVVKKAVPIVPPPPASPARTPVRLESEAERQKRLAEAERKKKEEEEKLKKEAEEKERKQREEEQRKKREQEEAEKLRRKEEEEKERKRKEEEEKERLRKEGEERKRREEEERVRKEQEERERARKEAEEQERLRKESEEKEKAEKERAAAAELKPEPIPEAEEGELQEGETKEGPKDEAKEKADKAALRIDTAISHAPPTRPRPGPLDLSQAKGHIPAPLPSALSTARVIEDIQSVPYPQGIKSPRVELNVNAKQGKFRYDREFLLQFMAVCKEKPDNLPPLDILGLEPQDQVPMSRTTSGRRQGSMGQMGPPSRSASVGLGIGFAGKPGAGASFTMGQFSTPASKMTSEERFARSASVSGGPAGMPLGRPVSMVRTASQGGPGTPMGGRTRSSRGGKRGEKAAAQPSAFTPAQQMPPFEPVAPLELSANRWTPSSVARKAQPVDETSPEIVERKVKGLLNKLTMERFDSISDQIIQWANKSETEKDGKTLIHVIKLVFEKATDEATWSEMYARLCRKMMEQISTKVQDDGIRSADGKPIAGGQLFRKYLLNRCQEDFERGWVAKETTAAAAVAKSAEDKAAQAANEKAKEGEGETILYSDEYYAAQKAKRQGLGLVKFIGELFKLQMLTERIMHECIKKLLSNVDNPEEEEIESLCKLMTTVGQQLDTPKARAHMDVYFTRMRELTKSPNVASRMQFMLQDVIELRERKWIPRNAMAAPTTLAAVHEAAQKEKESAQKDAYQRTLSMSRGGSRRGGAREEQVGPDGWAVAGNAAPPRPSKAGDLTNFGKIAKTQSMSFGPSSIFSKKESKSRESTISRTGSQNMFSMLSQTAAEEPPISKSSRSPSRKASIDLGPAGAPEPPAQRRKLQLLPRSIPKEDSKDTPATSTAPSEDESVDSGAAGMSEAEAKKKIDEDSKEFFSIRDLEEAEVYFTKLPVEHRHLLIDKLVTKAIESKEADSQLVGDLFQRAHSKNLVSPATFEQGFTPTAEILDDIAIDAPKAFQLFATMLKGAGLDKDEERRTRIADKSQDKDKLLGLLS